MQNSLQNIHYKCTQLQTRMHNVSLETVEDEQGSDDCSSTCVVMASNGMAVCNTTVVLVFVIDY